MARRGGLVAAAAVSMLVGAVAAAPGALADPPEHIRAHIGHSEDYDAGLACPFTTRFQLVGGNELYTFYDDGRFHATGRHVNQVTNMDTGASTILENQGSFDAVPTADGGSVMRAGGVTTFIFFPGDVGPGDTSTGRTWQFTGNLVLTSDPSGAITSFSSTGTSRNVCALIG